MCRVKTTKFPVPIKNIWTTNAKVYCSISSA